MEVRAGVSLWNLRPQLTHSWAMKVGIVGAHSHGGYVPSKSPRPLIPRWGASLTEAVVTLTIVSWRAFRGWEPFHADGKRTDPDAAECGKAVTSGGHRVLRSLEHLWIIERNLRNHLCPPILIFISLTKHATWLNRESTAVINIVTFI